MKNNETKNSKKFSSAKLQTKSLLVTNTKIPKIYNVNIRKNVITWQILFICYDSFTIVKRKDETSILSSFNLRFRLFNPLYLLANLPIFIYFFLCGKMQFLSEI